MKITCKIYPASPQSIKDAAILLRHGQVVAFPTETVYGLGGDATNDRAIAEIYGLKNRPSFNPLIVHIESIRKAEELAIFDERARYLAKMFWPGPLTMILPRSKTCPLSLLVSAGLDSVALRVPSHPVALALLTETWRPLAAPSANPSGFISPTTARHVADSLSPAMILDGGSCQIGIESTVIDLCRPDAIILRPGGIPSEQIAKEMAVIPYNGKSSSRSPGQLPSHYAPSLPVRLNAVSVSENEAFLGFGPVTGANLNLSPTGDLTEAAANLFAMLRNLDCPRFTAIAVSEIPRNGLGEAINDRLQRAAAPRVSNHKG